MDNGFYEYRKTDENSHNEVKAAFEKIGFSALNFTDSRSVYQFFNLKHLYKAIADCMERNIEKINLVTPPLKTSEIYSAVTGKTFENILNKPPFHYDLRTKYFESGYITSAADELNDICNFVKSSMKSEG